MAKNNLFNNRKERGQNYPRQSTESGARKPSFYSVKRLLRAGLTLGLAACLFGSCATTSGGGTAAGTLTITGIPAKLEGKFLKAVFFPPQTTTGFSKTVESAMTPVANGRAAFALNYAKLFGKGDGYSGSDTVDVEIVLRDTRANPGDVPPTFVTLAVPFKDGAADVQWDAVLKPGVSITITGIPALYNDQNGDVYVELNGGPLTALHPGSAIIKDGALTVTCLREDRGPYLFPTFNGTKAVTLSLADPERSKDFSPGFGVMGRINKYDLFLFKAARITNGKAELNFAASVKQ